MNRHEMIYMKDRGMWICDVVLEWQRYMYMLWFTWMIEIHVWVWFTRMTGIYGYAMVYVNDRDIGICCDLH